VSTITINTPVKVAAPRGAALAAKWFSKLLIGVDALLEGQRQRRQQARRVAEANDVRRYARQVMSQDRRFAADLLAAADRHERS
jgi:hypothetical protein